MGEAWTCQLINLSKETRHPLSSWVSSPMCLQLRFKSQLRLSLHLSSFKLTSLTLLALTQALLRLSGMYLTFLNHSPPGLISKNRNILLQFRCIQLYLKKSLMCPATCRQAALLRHVLHPKFGAFPICANAILQSMTSRKSSKPTNKSTTLSFRAFPTSKAC